MTDPEVAERLAKLAGRRARAAPSVDDTGVSIEDRADRPDGQDPVGQTVDASVPADASKPPAKVAGRARKGDHASSAQASNEEVAAERQARTPPSKATAGAARSRSPFAGKGQRVARPASTARVLATGASVGGMLALVAGMALSSDAAPAPTPAPVQQLAPPTAQPPAVRIIYRPVPAAGQPPATPATAPSSPPPTTAAVPPPPPAPPVTTSRAS